MIEERFCFTTKQEGVPLDANCTTMRQQLQSKQCISRTFHKRYAFSHPHRHRHCHCSLHWQCLTDFQGWVSWSWTGRDVQEMGESFEATVQPYVDGMGEGMRMMRMMRMMMMMMMMMRGQNKR